MGKMSGGKAFLLTFAIVWVGGPASCGAPQSHPIAETILRENTHVIVRAALEFHQSPRLLAGIIFAKRSLNVRPREKRRKK